MFQPAEGLLLTLGAGDRIAVLPSSELLFVARAGRPACEAALVRTRVSGFPVALLRCGPECPERIDLLRLLRVAPTVLSELRQLLGAEGAEALLAGSVAVTPGTLAAPVVRGELPVGGFCYPGGWLEGVGNPLPLPAVADLSRVVRATLRFAGADVALVATAAAFVRGAQAVLYGGVGHTRRQTPCFLAVVRPHGAAAASVLAPGFALRDVAELRAALAAEAPGAFRALLAGVPRAALRALERGELEDGAPEPWQAAELEEVVASAYALSQHAPLEALGYLTEVFGEAEEPEADGARAAVVLARVLHLWGGLARRAGHAFEAWRRYDEALALRPPPGLRAELHYGRGLAGLQATLPAGTPPPAEGALLAAGAFAQEATPAALGTWERARHDFAAAAAHDAQDPFARYHQALAALLLATDGGAALPLRRANALARAALAASARAATLATSPVARAAAEALAATARTVLARFAARPWWQRAFGRAGAA